jgi:hypothetical protein
MHILFHTHTSTDIWFLLFSSAGTANCANEHTNASTTTNANVNVNATTEFELSQSSQCGVMQHSHRSIQQQWHKVLHAAGFATVPPLQCPHTSNHKLDERTWLSFALGD